MRSLMFFAAAIGSATLIVACGNSHSRNPMSPSAATVNQSQNGAVTNATPHPNFSPPGPPLTPVGPPFTPPGPPPQVPPVVHR